MDPKEAIQSGQLDLALTEIQDTIRKKPADPSLRIYLFQLLSIMGQWERALNQLNVLSEMGQHKTLAEIFRPLVQCELLRASIFAGKTTPLVFGEPQAWVGLLVKALQEEIGGDAKLAAHIRKDALEEAPASSGKLDDELFNWMCDADSRLGPVLEACVDKKYYWIPFTAIKSITLQAPSDLRDLIWAPAEFTWINQGQANGHLSVRYPGTDETDDVQLKMARLTQWEEKSEKQYHGLGQKMLTTDRTDYSLLDIRTLQFEHG